MAFDQTGKSNWSKIDPSAYGDIQKSAGFREIRPGVFTNDEGSASGMAAWQQNGEWGYGSDPINDRAPETSVAPPQQLGPPDTVNYEGNNKPGTYVNPASPYQLGTSGAPPPGWQSPQQNIDDGGHKHEIPTEPYKRAQADDPKGPGYQPGSNPVLYAGYGEPTSRPTTPPAPTRVPPQGNPTGTPNQPPTSPLTAPAAPPTNFKPGETGGIVEDPHGVSSKLMDLLSARAGQSLNINPLSDSIITPQVANAAAIQERERRKYLDEEAERAGPYNTGSQQTLRTQTAEALGQNVSTLQNELVQKELAARRGEVTDSIQGMSGLLTNDQQLALQRQLGVSNADLAKYQIGTNANLGQQGLDIQKMLGLLGADMQQQGINNQNSQFYSGLSQQDKQFLNNLSLQYADLGSRNGLDNRRLDIQDRQFGVGNQLDRDRLQSENDRFLAQLGLNTTDRSNYWDYVRRTGGAPAGA